MEITSENVRRVRGKKSATRTTPRKLDGKSCLSEIVEANRQDGGVMSAPLDCGIEMVRGTDGYLCGRMGSEVCSDCGTALCDLHADACEFCLQVLCDGVCISMRTPREEAHDYMVS
jgi:hypothetical protein